MTLSAVYSISRPQDKQSRRRVNFFAPDVAWYTFEQESFDGKTKAVLSRSVETRMPEKHDGQWKIAYLGFHYLPLEEK